MKRKTNLFYSDGPDSKFITFSNYTESLTGNFLSTDTKLYPSSFLCLNIPELCDEENKSQFIKDYLIGYYENKLAFLRDYCIEQDTKPEDHLCPLAYLLEAVLKYANDNNINSENIISYVGDITEQDFNGTYTDTICIVDFAKHYIGSIVSEEDPHDEEYSPKKDENDDYQFQYLYGWGDKLGDSYTPKYDDTKDGISYYWFTSDLKSIKITNSQEIFIKFNVIIPLFDLTNINYRSLSYIEDNIIDKTDEISLVSNDDYKVTQRYVPLGMWFSESSIELKKDVNTGFSQSWSLIISSQFKPFPYSHELTNSVDNTTNSNAYPTFAMMICKQNEIIENFSKMVNTINEQKNDIQSIKSEMSNKSYQNNLDKLKREFINFEYEMTNKFNSFKQEIQQMIEHLTWNATK